MKRIGSVEPFGACGVYGYYVKRPEGATHFGLVVNPPLAVEFPPAAGLTRAHVVVQLMRGLEPPKFGNPQATNLRGAYDLTDERHGRPLPLGACDGIAIQDGGGAGCASIINGEVMWYRDTGEDT